MGAWAAVRAGHRRSGPGCGAFAALGQTLDQIGRRSKVEEAVGRVQTFLYSSHPEAKARLSNLNREVALNWYGADFGQTTVGKESYDRALRSGK